MNKIVVVDYGMGNLRSVAQALMHVAPEADVRISGDPEILRHADRLVLPGQGAMPDCMRSLRESGLFDVLMEAGWVRLAGRREVPGRPVIYATTPEFLDHFGLESRKDLPGIDELRAAGLLDPVDEAMEAAMRFESDEDDDQDANLAD